MIDLLKQFVFGLSAIRPHAFLLLGLVLFTGTVSARVFQKQHIPQVVGYILVGILLGRSGLNMIDKQSIEAMVPFNYFALGLISFMIGGELNRDMFRHYGRQLLVILFFEGITTFFAVFLTVGLVGHFFFEAGAYFWALGLLLGGIATATCPASSNNVILEYKTRGPLTSAVLGIVALDDVLALFLFSVAASIAGALIGNHSSGLLAVTRPVYEIVLSIIIGLITGFILIRLLRKYADKDKILVFSLAAILFVLGTAMMLKIDILLAAMTMGIVLVNFEARLSREVFRLISRFSAPFYILFFVLVGAQFNFRGITPAAFLIALAYLFGTAAGKMSGTFLGAKLSGSPRSVVRYLPFALFSQAGVAVGLSILVSQIFPGDMGNFMIVVVTLTTFVLQVLGPPCLKFALVKAKETGLNITDEDVLSANKVSRLLHQDPPYIYENAPLEDIFKIFSESNYHTYPVVDRQKRLKGIITLENIRRMVSHSAVGNLVIAHDLMESAIIRDINPTSSLLEAEEVIRRYGVDYLPIIDSQSVLLGLIEKEAIDKFVSAKLIEAEQQAVSIN